MHTESNKPKVTIGVCVRNAENTIGDAIESIKAQDYPHELMEIIFVDDGSEDNTLNIIKNYVSSMTISSKIFHTKWRGLGHARNIVVANASSEYIIWVDGDMIISKDFVRKLVEFICKNRKVGIAKGTQSLKPGNNILGTLEAYSRSVGRMIDYNQKKFQFKSLGTGGAIYRVEAIKQVGGFDESLKGYCEDWDIELRIRDFGWQFEIVNVEFTDYERCKLSLRSLWSRYWLRGYYTHYFLHKNRGLIKHCRMFPPAAFFAGLLNSVKLFRLTRKKFVFLLPFQYLFKFTAWYLGFIKSHINSYQPHKLAE